MSDTEDFGDVSEFETPPTNVARFLSQNPRYGEHVADLLKNQMTHQGIMMGKKIQKTLDKLGHDLSDKWGDYIMGVVNNALVSNLPSNVDKSDLLASEDPEGEIWEDTMMEAEADAMLYFTRALMPYVVSSARDLAEGLDWGFPFSISDLLNEEHPEIPQSPQDPIDERLL